MSWKPCGIWSGPVTWPGTHWLRCAPGSPGSVRTGASRPRVAPGTAGRASPALAPRTGPPTGVGRWYRLPERDADPTHRAAALTDALLDRHGVLTRGAVMAEGAP